MFAETLTLGMKSTTLHIYHSKVLLLSLQVIMLVSSLKFIKMSRAVEHTSSAGFEFISNTMNINLSLIELLQTCLE